MKASRYSKFSIKKLRGDKKVRLLQGAKEDDGKFYRCWNCGFQIDAMKTQSGGDSNIAYAEYTATQDGVTDATDLRNPVQYPDVSSGCPFCGTKNWK